MKMILEEYGKILITVIISIFLLIVVFSGLVKRWREYGGINDSIKTNFQSDEVKRTAPVIHAENIKTRKGESICFEKHIAAYDFDGSDITGDVEIACDFGTNHDKKYENMVSLYKNVCWDSQGIFYCDIQVKSSITGKTAKKKIVILVDCPQSLERRKKACG